jgi:hypothetical protein
MSRMTKSISLVLIGSALILTGCPSPRRVEPRSNVGVRTESPQERADREQKLGSMMAGTIVAGFTENPLTTVVAAGIVFTEAEEARVQGVAHPFVAGHGTTGTHRTVHHHHTRYASSPYVYGTGFHTRPAVAPATTTSRPSTSGSTSPSVSSSARGFGTTGHSVSS